MSAATTNYAKSPGRMLALLVLACSGFFLGLQNMVTFTGGWAGVGLNEPTAASVTALALVALALLYLIDAAAEVGTARRAVLIWLAIVLVGLVELALLTKHGVELQLTAVGQDQAKVEERTNKGEAADDARANIDMWEGQIQRLRDEITEHKEKQRIFASGDPERGGRVFKSSLSVDSVASRQLRIDAANTAILQLQEQIATERAKKQAALQERDAIVTTGTDQVLEHAFGSTITGAMAVAFIRNLILVVMTIGLKFYDARRMRLCRTEQGDYAEWEEMLPEHTEIIRLPRDWDSYSRDDKADVIADHLALVNPDQDHGVAVIVDGRPVDIAPRGRVVAERLAKIYGTHHRAITRAAGLADNIRRERLASGTRHVIDPDSTASSTVVSIGACRRA